MGSLGTRPSGFVRLAKPVYSQVVGESWFASLATMDPRQHAAMTVRNRPGSVPDHFAGYSLVELNSQPRAQASNFSTS
jgi:hypothetical protein